jgi:hypothetical protein
MDEAMSVVRNCGTMPVIAMCSPNCVRDAFHHKRVAEPFGVHNDRVDRWARGRIMPAIGRCNREPEVKLAAKLAPRLATGFELPIVGVAQGLRLVGGIGGRADATTLTAKFPRKNDQNNAIHFACRRTRLS